jgi:predicted negative regulator of RcsB-dependent stress response
VQGYTRRQLKEDKFVESAQGAAQWVSSHQRALIWSISTLVVVTLLVVGFIAWQSRQSDQANMALGAAMRTFSEPLHPAGAPATDANTGYATLAERGKASEKDFKSVADEFPHTRPGKIARYMAGVAAVQAGDKAGAEQQLKTASDSGDKDVASLAKMALGNFYRANNRQSDAVRIYKDLSEHPSDTVSKAEAQLELAAAYEATDPQQATTLYQQIQKENPQSPAAQTAAARLSGGKQAGQNLNLHF